MSPIKDFVPAPTAFDDQWHCYSQNVTRDPADYLAQGRQRGQRFPICHWGQTAPEHLGCNDVKTEVKEDETESDPSQR